MSFTPILNIEEIAANQNQKEVTANDAFIALEKASNDSLDVDLTSGNATLTTNQYTRAFYFRAYGHSVARDLTVPLTKRHFAVFNDGTDDVTVKGSTGATVVVGADEHVVLFCDGTDIILIATTAVGGSHTHTLSDITDVTATSAEVNILDGATLSVAELNILDGATLTTTELNYVDGVTSPIQTQLNGKAATSHSHATSDVTGLDTALLDIDDRLDDLEAGTTVESHTHLLAAITDVTASAAEVNILDGVTATTTELNYVSGVTSAIQTQLNGKAATSHTHTASDVSGRPCSVAVFVGGVGVNNEQVARFVVPYAFSVPSGGSGSGGSAAVAATGSTTYTAKKNGSSFATFVWSAAGTTASVTVGSTTSFAAGDILTIDGPATADGTLADIGITIAGTYT